MYIKFPEIVYTEKIWKNSVFIELCPCTEKEVVVEIVTRQRFKWIILTDSISGERILVIPKNTKPSSLMSEFEKVLSINKWSDELETVDFSKAKIFWKKHPSIIGALDISSYWDSVVESWNGNCNFLQEWWLRNPQIWALCSIISHSTISDSVATVVMPTWTGKTEVMIASMMSFRKRSVLIVVPTDALRGQLSQKFLRLWILKKLWVIDDNCKTPVVAILTHRPKDETEINQLLNANVIVSTMSILSGMTEDLQLRMANGVGYFFVDEAHHIGARTWHTFKENFWAKKVLQFTATPFRNDRKIIDGQIIYDYPLWRAQQENYFKKIQFKSVVKVDPEEANREIAGIAIAQLRSDIADGKNHVLMARCENIEEAIHIYETFYVQNSDLNPILVHSQLAAWESKTNLERLKSWESRIVVCVDMIWEGYDLPNLKVAALHTLPKSLWITLQIIGRFTRTAWEDIGDATVIANIFDGWFVKELELLYNENADWNRIISNLSTSTIKKHRKFLDFIVWFDQPDFQKELPIQNVRVPFSAMFFKIAEVHWDKDTVERCVKENFIEEDIWWIEHPTEKTLVAIERNNKFPDFWNFKDLLETDYLIHIVSYNESTNMMYVLSDGPSRAKNLLKYFTSRSSLISGEQVYRSFHNLNRLQLFTVGLSDPVSKNRSYSMHAGLDVTKALTDPEQINKLKTNIFWFGYEDWIASSVGASAKGKVWSKLRWNILEWIEWCRSTSGKLNNSSADLSSLLAKTLKPSRIKTRPNSFPISIDWDEEVYKNYDSCFIRTWDPEILVWVESLSISLLNPSSIDDILIRVNWDAFNASYKLQIFEEDSKPTYSFSKISGDDGFIQIWGRSAPILEFLTENPPLIIFAEGSILLGNVFIQVDYSQETFDSSIIEILDWTGTDIKKESQGIELASKRTDSIQFRIINDLLSDANYDVIFNDDWSGEIADVVAIRIDEVEQRVELSLYHCKWSHEATPWARVKDLYEVCWQAQKSIRWHDVQKTIKRLMKRGWENPARFERWDIGTLDRIKKALEYFEHSTSIYVVQPGLSKGLISQEQKALITVTESYLRQVFQIPLKILASN